MTDTVQPLRRRKIYELDLDVVFPNGICAGAGSFGNLIQPAQNGQGEWVLHGTAVAGILRQAFRSLHPKDPEYIDRFFGSAHGDSDRETGGRPSLLSVDDAFFKREKTNSVQRTSHLRCRHTRSVADGALYSVEAVPPNAETRFHLTLTSDSPQAAETFFNELAGILRSGLIFGGNGNRGIGLARVKGDIFCREYDLSRLDGYAEWLNDDYTRRSGGCVSGGKPLTSNVSDGETLRVTWDFIIPPGQDLLVADGEGLDATSEPHRVTATDGWDYWLLPGSTLRGLFRSEYTRLAAREGKNTVDSVERYQKDGPASGDDLGWMFNKKEKDSDFYQMIDRDYPTESLFGSLHRAGRLHITDALSRVGAEGKLMSELAVDEAFPVQYRVHVAVDPISGGAVDGALFDNFVLTGGGGKHAVRFPVTMIVHRPTSDDVRRLAQTLREIQTGFLRVGSSKSAGRLAVLDNSLKAEGKFGSEFLTRWNTVSDMAPVQIKDDKTDPLPKDTAAAKKEIIRGRMDGNVTKYVAEYLKDGKKQKVNIPNSLWGYRRGDVINKPFVDLTFVDGELVDVVIPNRPKKNQGSAASQPSNPGGDSQIGSGHRGSSETPIATNNLSQASASVLGMPFHNPYTFIPFEKTAPKRKEATPLTVDEIENDRFSGVLEVELENLSPLLISEGWCREAKESVRRGEKINITDHKVYDIQKIGSDVILPATGVRGFLRNLTTIVTGGPLSVLEEETYLCQGRDLQLTPRTAGMPTLPPCVLARVIEPGNALKSGKIEIGETILVTENELKNELKDELERVYGAKLPRPKPGERAITWLWAKIRNGSVSSLTKKKDEEHTAQIKLSGRPVNTKGKKKEGAFLKVISTLELPPNYWAAYNSRNRHGDHPELKKWDLIWIEPREIGMTSAQIQSVNDIASLQWARWGRRGKKIVNVMPDHLLPDSHRDDELVAMVTDLFGQVPIRKGSRGKTFKGRIMPGNLVFQNGNSQTEKEIPLAVMGMPHLGCIPFYRKSTDPRKVSSQDHLRGYKVYRTEKPGRSSLPWRFETQGIYDDSGRLKSNRCQKLNISAELLKSGQKGTVSISLHALSREELALILYLCQGTWRLGGGKPIGLGVCRVLGIRLWNESGCLVNPESYPMTAETIKKRFQYWTKTQQPVGLLRYPRAVSRNTNKNSRGGMVWFQKCAQMKKGGDRDGNVDGLGPIYVCGGLMEKARKNGADNSTLSEKVDLIAGQTLPFLPETPENEFLYGYDALFCDCAAPSDDPSELKQLERKRLEFNRKKMDCYPDIVPFDESKHISGSERSEENRSQNRETRQQSRRDRQ